LPPPFHAIKKEFAFQAGDILWRERAFAKHLRYDTHGSDLYNE